MRELEYYELPEQGERERDDEYVLRVMGEGLAHLRQQGLSRAELREAQQRGVWHLASILVTTALSRDAVLRRLVHGGSLPLDEITGQRVLDILRERPIITRRGKREAMRTRPLIDALVIVALDAYIGSPEFLEDLGRTRAIGTGDDRRPGQRGGAG